METVQQKSSKAVAHCVKSWNDFVVRFQTHCQQFQICVKVSMFFEKIKRKVTPKTANSRIKSTQKKLWHFKLMRLAAIGALVGSVLMIVVFFGAFAWFSRELPKPGEVVRRDGFSTKILDRKGALLYDLFDDERRTPIDIASVPEHLKQATIATEDKDFYKHQGFDALTIVRIPYNFLFRGRVVGGSTLTQQLVKNALLTNERSIERKFKEFVLSLQIERTFTKDEILEMYLNEAPYGGTAWGIGTASEIYFNKPVSELSLVESAILAGLPQRPTAYSPYTGGTDDDGVPLWKIRAQGVLRRMHEDGYLTDLAHDDAVSQLDSVVFERSAIEINAPHFVFYVRDILGEMYGEEVVETGGFKVTTSLDLELQNTAQDIVREEIDKVAENLNITNGSVMMMDPQTGEILVMVGSKDYSNSEIGGQFNVAVDGLRQPGSSIKPVTYLTLLEQGYTPASMLLDVPTAFTPDESSDPYEPNNYDGKFRGPVNVRNSLGSSLNIPAVKALGIVGIDSFLQQAHQMGFVTLEPTAENFRRFGLAVTLGGAEVHLIDTVSSYSSFANGGTKVEPVAILKIEDKDGNIIFEHRPVAGEQVVSESGAFLINHILSDNNARSIAFGTNSLLNLGAGVAVKTGTTNDQRDNWAIGWSQDVIVGAWVGNNDNSAMKQVASGVSGATPIWRRVLQAALEAGYAAPAWTAPESVEQVKLDSISGYPEHDEFASVVEYATKGTVPSLPDPIHTKLKLCRGEEKLAPPARVTAGEYDEREYIVLKEDDPISQDSKNRWQEAIDRWISTQEDSRYKPPTEFCGDQEEIFVKIEKPNHQRSLDEENVEIQINSDSADGIEKLELFVNGQLRETINNREYKGTISLPAGRYDLKAKAYSRNGESKESAVVKIGTGGVDWDEPDPSPTPSPVATPIATPNPSPLLDEILDD
ncbi:MAG: transglycosylase domain-containing protein [Microgenomates group bacterium]